jgi:hypothetical protein
MLPIGDMPATERIQMAQALPHDLTEAQQEQLLAFLPRITHLADMPDAARPFLAEILFEVLRQQKNPPADLPEVLQRIYSDPDTDILIRGYAVQHIGHLLIDQPYQARTGDMLWEAAAMATEPFAGMALIALDRLHRKIGFDDERLHAAALRIATAPDAVPAARMCALDVCARRTVAEALPHARELAGSEHPLSVRLAAIHALGLLGQAADREQLIHWSLDEGTHHQAAAVQALKKLEQRLVL